MSRLLSGLVILYLAMTAIIGQAQVVVGKPIPPLEIKKPGELILEGEDTIRYQPWNTGLLVGKVHVVQYLAGRLGVKDMNKALTDALESKNFADEYLHNTTIINLDDTLFGTAGIVNSQLKGNKIKYWFSSIVADREGDGATLWRLKPKSSAIILLSPDSGVLFFKDGKLDELEINQVLDLIQRQIGQLQKSHLQADAAR